MTLFHWDLPQYIEDQGGFTSPLLVDTFKNFADVVFQNFGDRVQIWITFNEPYIFCTNGYGIGRMAPGKTNSEYLCSHYVLQAHSAAYHLYKKKYAKIQKGQIGISLNTRFFYPKDETVGQNLIEKALEFQV